MASVEGLFPDVLEASHQLITDPDFNMMLQGMFRQRLNQMVDENALTQAEADEVAESLWAEIEKRPGGRTLSIAD